MSLELDDLIADPEPVTQQRRGFSDESVESVAVAIDKAALLEAFKSEIELVEAQGQAESGVMSVAHAEDVTAGAEAISWWLRERHSTQPVVLGELQRSLGMPLVEVWLGLLLGKHGIRLKQQGKFYDSSSIYIFEAHSGSAKEAAKL